MKFYNIILFASLILYILSEDNECEQKTSASKAKDCKDLKASDGDHCCYLKAKKDDQEYSGCTPVSKEAYNKIKDYIKEMEKTGGKVKKLDCKSIYLELSILSFIFLLL